MSLVLCCSAASDSESITLMRFGIFCSKTYIITQSKVFKPRENSNLLEIKYPISDIRKFEFSCGSIFLKAEFDKKNIWKIAINYLESA